MTPQVLCSEPMVLKAVFLEFSGVLIKDASLQSELINNTLIAENLRPNPAEFAQVCVGRGDRACLNDLLTRRGRVTSKTSLDKLLASKSAAYIEKLTTKRKLPLYAGLEDLLYKLKAAELPLGITTAARHVEIDWVLTQTNLSAQFTVKVTGEDIAIDEDKPATKVYEIAIARLNERYPKLQAIPSECLAIEASFVGITAARGAGIPVVGVAHLYPYRMMQRRAQWAVDYLNEIDLDWIQRQYK